tara:strand:- start:317 stop:826 length:510 start_codon:yes stop_codon:yes gene_type:complete
MAKKGTVSPYTILNRWLYDGSKSTPLPEELATGYAIGQTILLYHFQQSEHIVYLSEMFNNYSLYTMPKEDVFKMLKDCVQRTGFKPRFIAHTKETKSKVSKALKKHHPYLDQDDVNLLTDLIESRDDKESLYETLGVWDRKPRKKKLTKKEKDQFAKTVAKKIEKDKDE